MRTSETDNALERKRTPSPQHPILHCASLLGLHFLRPGIALGFLRMDPWGPVVLGMGPVVLTMALWAQLDLLVGLALGMVGALRGPALGLFLLGLTLGLFLLGLAVHLFLRGLMLRLHLEGRALALAHPMRGQDM